MPVASHRQYRHSSFGGIPSAAAADWDRLAGGNFYSSRAWLSFTGGEPGADSYVAARYSGGRLAAAVPVADLTAPPMPLYRWDDILSGLGLPTLGPRGLMAGPRQGYQTHFLVADGEPRTQRIGELLADIRREHARPRDRDEPGKHGRACVAMYVTTADALALRENGVTATPVLLGADAWIEVPPGGWTDWLAAQPRNRKVKARKERRLFDAAGYRIEHRALRDCAEELAPAAAATQAKYGRTEGAGHYRRELRRLADAMGPAARVAVCSRGTGGPLGFCVYFRWGDTVFLRWAGFDYPRLAGAAEYFNLLYYEQIAAADGDVRWIHAGIESVAAKARRGARLRPLWLVDLAEDSVLAGHADAIREHNARGYRELAADTQTRGALTDRAAWEAFGAAPATE